MPDRSRERPRRASAIATRSDLEMRPLAPGADAELYEPPALETETLAAVLGKAGRRGEWDPPELLRVFACLGQAHLDFTQALMPPGITEVQIFTLLGSARVVVPEGLEVEVTGSALLGDFKQSTGPGRARRLLRRTLRAARGEVEEPFDEDEEPPLLRVSGLAVLGSVVVRVR